MACWHFCGCWG
ncbi:hypothetical protein VCHC55A1_0327, partial [Vibrio cholerae HC-55A1]